MCLIFYEAGSLHSLKIAEQRIATSGFNASHSIYVSSSRPTGLTRVTNRPYPRLYSAHV